MNWLPCWIVLFGVVGVVALAHRHSLKEFEKLPHLRHWLHRMERQLEHGDPACSSGSTPPPVSTKAAVEFDSRQSGEEEQLQHHLSGGEDGGGGGGGGGGGRGGGGGWKDTTLTVSQAKEKLREQKSNKRRTSIKKDKNHLRQHGDNHHHHHHRRQHPQEDPTSPPKDEVVALEVKKHIERMAGSACRVPRPKLVNVRDYLLSSSAGGDETSQEASAVASVRYVPRCTWLHRCSDDSGCCAHESDTCSASHVALVSLPFFAMSMEGTEQKRSTVKLSFENHTRCECVGRNSDLMPRTEEVIHGPRGHHLMTEVIRQRTNASGSVAAARKRTKDEPEEEAEEVAEERHNYPHGRVAMGYLDGPLQQQQLQQQQKQQLSIHSGCRCPSDYAIFSPVDGHCVCDCLSDGGRDNCWRLKRGLDSFFLRDRGCISQKKCAVPKCEYGTYISTFGRCPKREEKSQRWLRLVS